MYRIRKTRRRPSRDVSDDERLMGTFFYKVAALAAGLLALAALAVWFLVRLIF